MISNHSDEKKTQWIIANNGTFRLVSVLNQSSKRRYKHKKTKCKMITTKKY